MLVTVRHAPYGSSRARSALDVALASAAFEQPVSLLFLGDGVLQLMPEQDSATLGVRNIGRLLASLPLYDIESVYVDADAASRYGLDLAMAPLPTRSLDSTGIQQLMASCDHLLGF